MTRTMAMTTARATTTATAKTTITARTKATATANAGVLRFAQNDRVRSRGRGKPYRKRNDTQKTTKARSKGQAIVS
jgi:hypothetical protein